MTDMLPPSGSDDTDQSDAQDLAVVARWWGYRIGQLLGGLIIFALVVLTFAVIIAAVLGAVYLAVHADPGEIEPRPDAGYIDLVFSDRWVVWAARVVLFFAALAAITGTLWITASAVARMKSRHWLRSGFGLTADVKEIESNVDDATIYDDLLDEAWTERDRALAELANVTDELERVKEDRHKLARLAYVARLREGAPDEEGKG